MADTKLGYSPEAIKSAWADPEFQAESEDSRIAIMAEMDPRFAAFDGLRRRRVVRTMYDTFSKSQPKPAVRPPQEAMADAALADSGLPPASVPATGAPIVPMEEAGILGGDPVQRSFNPMRRQGIPAPIAPMQPPPPAAPPPVQTSQAKPTPPQQPIIPPAKPPGAPRQISRPGPTTTRLNPVEEAEFNQWLKATGTPFDPSPAGDYDMRGYWQAMKRRDDRALKTKLGPDGQQQLPDEWNRPNHKRFSNKSIYAGVDAPKLVNGQIVDVDGNVIVDEKAEKEAAKLAQQREKDEKWVREQLGKVDQKEGDTLVKLAQKRDDDAVKLRRTWGDQQQKLDQKRMEIASKKPEAFQAVVGMEKLGGAPPGVPVPTPPLAEVSAPSLPGDVAGGFVRGAANATLSIPRVAAQLPGGFQDTMIGLQPQRRGELIGAPVNPDQRDATARRQFAANVNRIEQGMLPDAPVTTAGQFAEALGSTTPYMAAGAVGGTPATTAMGVIAGIDEAMQRANQSGIPLTAEQRAGIAATGAAIGATEAITYDRLFRIFKGAGVVKEGMDPKEFIKQVFPTLKDFAKSAAIQAAEEGGQELFSGVSQDTLEYVYGGRSGDRIGEEWKRDLMLGGGVGAVLDVMMKLAGIPVGRARLRDSGIDPDSLRAYVEQNGGINQVTSEAEGDTAVSDTQLGTAPSAQSSQAPQVPVVEVPPPSPAATPSTPEAAPVAAPPPRRNPMRPVKPAPIDIEEIPADIAEKLDEEEQAYVDEQPISPLTNTNSPEQAPVATPAPSQNAPEVDAMLADQNRDLTENEYAAAVETLKQNGKVTVTTLQRDLNIWERQADQIIDRMDADGLLNPVTGTGTAANIRTYKRPSVDAKKTEVAQAPIQENVPPAPEVSAPPQNISEGLPGSAPESQPAVEPGPGEGVVQPKPSEAAAPVEAGKPQRINISTERDLPISAIRNGNNVVLSITRRETPTEIFDTEDRSLLAQGQPFVLNISRPEWEAVKKSSANEVYAKKQFLVERMANSGHAIFTGSNGSIFDRAADHAVKALSDLFDGAPAPVKRPNPTRRGQTAPAPATAPAEPSLADLAGISEDELLAQADAALQGMGYKPTAAPPATPPAPAPKRKNPMRPKQTEPAAAPEPAKTENPLDAAAKAAADRLANKFKNLAQGSQLNAGIDPTDLVDLATIGAKHILDGAKAVKDWASRVNAELGPIIDAIAEQANLTRKAVLKQVHSLARKLAGRYGVVDAEEATDESIDDEQSTPDSGTLEAELPGSGEGAGKRGDSGRVGGGRRGSRGASNAPVAREGDVDTGGDGTGTERVGPSAEPSDYRIPDNRSITGSPEKRFEMNLAAIKLLRELEKEDRKATPEEQEVLAHFVGWGAVPQVFAGDTAEWKARQDELKAVMSDEEYSDASRSTTNAHYTGDEQVDAIWHALKHLGIKPGMSYLEPSVGIGNFFGRQPADTLAGSRRVGFDKDSITGKLAKYLYPNASIEVMPFEQSDLPKNYFDVAVSNVPFGSFGVHDPEFKNKPFLTNPIHNYFFAKSLEAVRPGGIVAFVTSRFTMDAFGKPANQFRDYIKDKADFLGAVRLPTNAFMSSSGTHVITDVIFLRKKEPGEESQGEQWARTGDVTTPVRTKGWEGGDYTHAINEYYVAHPENVLGEQVSDRGQYSQADYAVKGKVTGDSLKEAFERVLPKDVFRGESATQEDTRIRTGQVEGAAEEKVGAFFTDKKGKLYRRKSKGEVEPVEATGNEKKRIVGQIAIRDSLQELLKAELSDMEDAELDKLRKKLNKDYDAFYEQFGALSWRNNIKAFDGDPDLPLLLSLERDVNKQTAKKQPIFTTRVLEPARPVTSADSSEEALTVSLNELGRVDWARMSALTGKKPEELQKDLAGVVFQNPSNRGWEIAEEYLSGNVRKKLADAEKIAKIEPKFQPNVEALKKALPEDIQPHDISARLGNSWIPAEVYEEFLHDVLGIPERRSIKVHHNKATGTWLVDTEWTDATNKKFETPSVLQQQILDAAFNSRRVKVRDDEGHVLPAQTAAANAKIDDAHEAFRKWAFLDDIERSKRLAKVYNDKMNDIRLRSFDGGHLTLPGKAAAIKLFPHQKSAIWRMITQKNTLLAHTVGAGKTFEMIAGTMELRRMGLVKRPMFVVPNATLPGWQEQFGALYPNAKVIIFSENDLKKENRRATIAKIATGNWDAVVLPHSSFGLIKVSDEMFEEGYQEQVRLLQEQVKDAYEAGVDTRRIKAMETANERILKRLADRRNEARQDDTVSWDQLGIDMLVVDEAHEYKKLGFSSKMGQIAGIDSGNNQKTFDLHMKTRHVQKNGRGVVFATGTPITNTMGEMYNMMRYLIPDELHARNMSNFDDWAANFGRAVSVWEPKPEGGGYKLKERFAKFVNLPELATLFRSFADVVTSDMLDIPRPTPHQKTITTELNESQKHLMEHLQQRAAAVRADPRGAMPDNMLAIYGDAQKLALDPRFLSPHAPDYEDNRLNKVADQVYEIWEATKDKRSTQIVFSDLGVPGTKGASVFPMYDTLINKLVKRGIPRDEIAHIYSANNKQDRARMFNAMNEGKIRVLLGSTMKLGVGVNVQKKLAALHHMDLPHRPSDVEQRNGRGHRQGNENSDLDIYTYLTKGTLDELKASTLGRKAKFISQTLQGKLTVREADDVDGLVASFEAFQKAAANDPRVPLMLDLTGEVDRLGMIRREWARQQYNEKMEGEATKQRIPTVEEHISGLKKAIEKRDSVGRVWEIDGNKLEGAGISDAVGEAARKKMIANAEQISGDPKLQVDFGTVHGFPLTQSVSAFDKDTFIIRSPGLLSVEVSDINNVGPGFVQSVENQLRGLEKRVKNNEDDLEHMHNRLKSIAKNRDEKWSHEAELKEKEQKLKALKVELGMDKDTGDVDIGVDEIKDDSVEAEETDDDETVAVVEDLVKDKADDEAGTEVNRNPTRRRRETQGGFMAPDMASALFSGLKSRLRGNPARRSNAPLLHEFPGEVEGRVQRAGKPQTEPDGIVAKLKELWEAFRGLLRTYRNLPRDKYGKLIAAMKKLEKAHGIASSKAIISLSKTIADMSVPEYDLFRKWVLVDDLLETIELFGESGATLPNELAFGFTPETLREHHALVKEKIEGNERLAEAARHRREVWENIKGEYIPAMKAAGADVSGKMQRKSYYRHRVLMQKRLEDIASGKVQTPTNRSFLKRRDVENVGDDYATNFIETELQVMTQLMVDTQVANFVSFLKDNYDKIGDLKDQAKWRNVQTVMPYFQAMADEANAQRGPQSEGEPLTAEDMFRRTLNRSQAIAIQELSRMAANGQLPDTENGKWADTIEALADNYLMSQSEDDDVTFNYADVPGLLGYAAWILKQPEATAGSRAAGQLFKGIRQKQEAIKRIAGDDFVTWEKLVPDTHEAYQMDPTKAFYSVFTIPEHIAMAAMEENAEKIGISAEDIKKVFARGADKEPMVLPKEVVKQFEEMQAKLADARKSDNIIYQASRAAMGKWKQYMLHAPQRVLKYLARNQSGDLDSMIAGLPWGRAMKHVKPALTTYRKEVGDYFGPIMRGKLAEAKLSPELEKFASYGPFQNLLSVYETGDPAVVSSLLNELSAWEKKEPGPSLAKKATTGAYSAWMHKTGIVNDAREAMNRYAVYRIFLDDIQSNGGNPTTYSASSPEQINDLETAEDKAYQMSNDLMGAYDELSVAGQWIRKWAIPFWSYQELNFKRYMRLVRNGIREGSTASRIGQMAIGKAMRAPYLAYKTGTTVMGMYAMWALLNAINMFHDEEDKELRKDIRQRPHLTFGGSEDKKEVYHFTRLGNIADMLEWIDIEEGKEQLSAALNGQKPFNEAMYEAFRGGPMEKMFLSSGPHVKYFAEGLTGRSFFPNVDRPRMIESWPEKLAQDAAMGDLYRAAAGKPMKQQSWPSRLKDLAIYTSDPKESAYYDIQEVKRQWMEKNGLPPNEFSSDSKKAIAMRNIKRSLRATDKVAFEKYLKEYISLGGTPESFDKSIEYMDPLSGLRKNPKDDEDESLREQFIESLSAEDKKRLALAIEYYNETFLGETAEEYIRSFAEK